MSKNSILLSLFVLLALAFNPIWAEDETESSENDNTEQSTENSDDDSVDDNGLTGCEVIVDLDKGTMEMPCVLVNGEQYQVKMSTQRGNSMNWKVVFLALEDDSVILDESDDSNDDTSNDNSSNEEDDSSNDTSSNEEDDSGNDSSNDENENEEEDDEEDEEDDSENEECVPANANANNCKDKEK